MNHILTYSRKTFDADYARALNGATGALRDDLAKKKTLTLQALNAGKIDLRGRSNRGAFEANRWTATLSSLLSARPGTR